MGKRMTIAEVADIPEIGLSAYALRLGIRQGRFPFIRTGGDKGRILIDVDLLEMYLRQEAERNASSAMTNENAGVVHFGQLRQVKA